MRRYAVIALVLAACQDPPLSSVGEKMPTSCTAVGCRSQVTANLLGVLATDTSTAPMGIEVCADQACMSAEVTFEEGSDGGPACTATGHGTACCVVDPASAASGAACLAAAGSDLRVTVPVPDGEAFAGAVIATGVTLRDQNGAVLLSASQEAKLLGAYLNGYECDPACYIGTADFGTP